MASVAAREVERARGARIRVLLGADDGVPRFYTRCFTIDPGGRIPLHRHDRIEHEQVVLEGEMTLTLDSEQRTTRPGDCIYIPAGVAHAYQNQGEIPVRFLCMVPATSDYATEWLE
jgi:quercetin dioxygenase-like cupin family protein